MCIATNATISRRPLIELALERVGLRAYINHIFCFTEMGQRNESPDFWLAVAKRLGVKPSALAMVGDTLEPDALAPQRLGVLARLCPTPASREKCSDGVCVVGSLSEFARLVEDAAVPQAGQ